jgi:hypothetical protein
MSAAHFARTKKLVFTQAEVFRISWSGKILLLKADENEKHPNNNVGHVQKVRMQPF